MQIVDIRVEADREAGLQGMQNVTFRGGEGETVTVRLRGSADPADRADLVERAKAVIQDVATARTDSPLPPDVAAGLPDAAGTEIQGRLSLDENSDNAYQASDDALPGDELERTLARNPGRTGGRFDDV